MNMFVRNMMFFVAILYKWFRS